MSLTSAIDARIEEKRKEKRTHTVLRAVIELHDHRTTYDCTISNLSDHGANLHIENAFILPSDFQVSIPLKGLKQNAVVRWREVDQVGVEFTSADTASLEYRVLILEEELRSLRKFLARSYNSTRSAGEKQ